MDKETEITYMKVRLFRLAQKRWKTDFAHTGDIFSRYHLYEYIDDMYEEFHVQGDDVNLDELQDYLRRQGVSV